MWPVSRRSAIKAIDPATGREVWSWRSEHPMVGSLLATAGGLLFAGAPTGELLAFKAHTGRVLWRYQTGSGIHGNPITYGVNGTQYVAVPSGWGGWVKGFAPELLGASRGSALFAFALPELGKECPGHASSRSSAKAYCTGSAPPELAEPQQRRQARDATTSRNSDST